MCVCLNFYVFSLTGSLESDSYHWEIMGVYDRIAGDVKQSSGMLFRTRTPHWPMLIPCWITRQQRCWIFHKHLILCMWIFLLHFVCSPRQQQWDKTGFYQFIVFPLAKVTSRELLLFRAKLLTCKKWSKTILTLWECDKYVQVRGLDLNILWSACVKILVIWHCLNSISKFLMLCSAYFIFCE